MKKLGKLNLMKEKMLSHEELVNFRGGSGGEKCTTTCTASGTTYYCASSGVIDCTCPAAGGTTCS